MYLCRHWFDCLDPSGVDDSSTGAHTKGRVEDGEPFASKDTRDIFNLFTHWKMLLIGEEDAGVYVDTVQSVYTICNVYC